MVLIEYDTSTNQIINIGLAAEGLNLNAFPANYALIDETQYPGLLNNWHYGVYENGQITFILPAPPTPPTATELLTDAQQFQIDTINNGYNATMSSGFTSNASGTLDTYAIDPVSMGKWTGILAVINSGIGPSSQTVKDLAGNKVTLTATQFKQFALDGLNFFNAQEQQLWALEEQINTQTAVPATLVTWTPGDYTPQPAPSS